MFPPEAFKKSTIPKPPEALTERNRDTPPPPKKPPGDVCSTHHLGDFCKLQTAHSRLPSGALRGTVLGVACTESGPLLDILGVRGFGVLGSGVSIPSSFLLVGAPPLSETAGTVCTTPPPSDDSPSFWGGGCEVSGGDCRSNSAARMARRVFCLMFGGLYRRQGRKADGIFALVAASMEGNLVACSCESICKWIGQLV